tara:strand:+ start:709 stop:1092 length:384 start_codon:yes stop_codon:yes gene_type:complete
MAALGYAMIGGMIVGAGANAVMDTINVDKNCEIAKDMIENMKKMRAFYNSISDENTRNQQTCQELIDTLKQKHLEHQSSIDDYLKNNNDRQKRMELILTLSLSIILVNFIIKSKVLVMLYNNLFSKN